MQQRQLRLGDILDDYCPRERRVTNHAVVAMVGPDVKQTRCTTCEAEHEYKHARVPRQRKKSDTPSALYAQVAAGAPKRIVHDRDEGPERELTSLAQAGEMPEHPAPAVAAPEPASAPAQEPARSDEHGDTRAEDEGPVQRPLIRASLPRPDGQQPPARPVPEFTIRQPGGRPARFRPRHQRGGQAFHAARGPRSSVGGSMRGHMRSDGVPARMAKRHGGAGQKRSK